MTTPRTHRLHLSRVALLLCGVAAPVWAQARPDSTLPRRRAQVCDMRYKLLELRITDSTGAPVPGVSAVLRRDGRAAPVRTATTSPQGYVTVAEDSDLQRLPAAGAGYTLTLRKAAKSRRVALRLGRDAAGCHVALLSGEATITF